MAMGAIFVAIKGLPGLASLTRQHVGSHAARRQGQQQSCMLVPLDTMCSAHHISMGAGLHPAVKCNAKASLSWIAFFTQSQEQSTDKALMAALTAVQQLHPAAAGCSCRVQQPVHAIGVLWQRAGAFMAHLHG
jgi:hypothetical protein